MGSKNVTQRQAKNDRSIEEYMKKYPKRRMSWPIKDSLLEQEAETIRAQRLNKNEISYEDPSVINTGYDKSGIFIDNRSHAVEHFVWPQNAASVDGEQQFGYSYVIVKNGIPWKSYDTRDAAVADILKLHLGICTVCKNQVKYKELVPFHYSAKCNDDSVSSIAIGYEAMRRMQNYYDCSKFDIWISFVANNVIQEHCNIYVSFDSVIDKPKRWTAHQFHGTSDPNDVLIGSTIIRDPNNVLINSNDYDNDVPHQEEGFGEPSAPEIN